MFSVGTKKSKATKRLTKDIQQFKVQRATEINGTLDTLTLIRQQISRAESGPLRLLRGSEIFFYIPCGKKRKDGGTTSGTGPSNPSNSTSKGVPRTSTNPSSTNPSSTGIPLGRNVMKTNPTNVNESNLSRTERCLVIFRRTETSFHQQDSTTSINNKSSSHKQDVETSSNMMSSISIVRFIRREDELEVKGTYDIGSLISIDYGGDELELVLSYENTDQTLYFTSQTDRDETLWIIAQIHKCLLSSQIQYLTRHSSSNPTTTSTVNRIYQRELSIGYSVDIDALNYMMATSSALTTRFPLLSSYLSTFSEQLGEQFTVDEAEAESVLDALNWSAASLGGLTEIHSLLNKRNDTLNDEIIDFLLQWEQMDHTSSGSTNKTSSSSMSSSSSNPMIRGNSGKTYRTNSQTHGLRDIHGVLNKLDDTLLKLSDADRWLSQQIDQLSSIQTNLRMIETESGTLETSWQNLSQVQRVVSHLVSTYSLTSTQEAILNSPDKHLANVFKSNTNISNLGIELKPLIDAAIALRLALDNREQTSELFGLSATEWKQIQAIHAIRVQKDHLLKISERFITKFNDSRGALFEWILKHRTLSEVLLPKIWKTKTILTCLTNNNQHEMTFDLAKDLRKLVDNQLLRCQSHYHNVIRHFEPLFDAFTALSGSQTLLVESYVRATQSRLYGPLLKAFIKDLSTILMNNRIQSPLSLANLPKHRGPDGSGELAMKFHGGIENFIPPWRAFEAALLVLAPFLEVEEGFIKRTFGITASQPIDDDSGDLSASAYAAQSNSTLSSVEDDGFSRSRLCVVLDGLFEGLLPRLISIPDTNFSAAGSGISTHDGLAAIACETVLTQFSSNYLELIGAQQVELQAQAVASANAVLAADYRPPTATHPVVTLGDEPLWQYGDAIEGNHRFLLRIVRGLQRGLDNSVSLYGRESLAWLSTQKADAKLSTVFSPVIRFVSLVEHSMELSQGRPIPILDTLLRDLGTAVMQWTESNAASVPKYTTKAILANMSFLAHHLRTTGPPPALSPLLTTITATTSAAQRAYLSALLASELPAIAALADRAADLPFLLAPQARAVAKELDPKTLDASIAALWKRVDKHFRSEYDGGVGLQVAIWTAAQWRLVETVRRVERCASQIKPLEVTSDMLLKRLESVTRSLESGTSASRNTGSSGSSSVPTSTVTKPAFLSSSVDKSAASNYPTSSIATGGVELSRTSSSSSLMRSSSFASLEDISASSTGSFGMAPSPVSTAPLTTTSSRPQNPLAGRMPTAGTGAPRTTPPPKPLFPGRSN